VIREALTGGPGEFSAGEDVEVEVEDGLLGAGTAVEDGAVVGVA